MGRHLIRFFKNMIDQRRPIFISRYLSCMPQSEFSTNLRHARLVAKENDLGARLQQGPARNRVALNDGNVRVRERFWAGKDGQHVSVPRASSIDTERRLPDQGAGTAPDHWEPDFATIANNLSTPAARSHRQSRQASIV